MKEKNKKRQIAKISIFITSIFVIFMSITYAFITQTLTGTKEVVINAGVLDLVLEEENAITISDALPMYDEVGMIQEDVFEFRLINNTSNPTNYILKLSKIDADNELSPSDVKYYLTKEGVGEPQLLSTLRSDGTVDSGIIAGNDTIDYTLRLWIDSSVTDNSKINGKSLSYKLVVDVSQDLMFVKALDDIVIDFGLPVEIKYSKLDEGTVIEELSYAKYGKVEIDGDSSKEDFVVTYTPTEVLKGIDTVHLRTNNNKEYTFNVYPATTVYYEEGFTSMNGFTEGSKGTGIQTASKIGDKSHYGYDVIYAKEIIGPSNGTQAISNTAGDNVTFEFIGQGVDIYANNTSTTGAMSVKLYTVDINGKSTLKKSYIVQTAMKNGESTTTTEQDVSAYNMPIVSIADLTYGKYKVVIQNLKKSAKEGAGLVQLDGFRVYGTLEDTNSSAYINDKENSPKFIKLRDSVLSTLGVDNNDTNNDQIYQKIEEKSGVTLLGIDFTDEMIQDLLNNGPKNELFLQPGQTIVFALNESVNAQIGLKAPVGTVRYKMLSSDEEFILNSSTDMFYHDLTGQVAIANTGDNILSITKLKAFGETETYFTDVTIDTVNKALDMLNN